MMHGQPNIAIRQSSSPYPSLYDFRTSTKLSNLTDCLRQDKCR